MPEPNEAIGGIVDELISKAKAEIELGKEGSDAKYWEGAEEALLRMEEDKDDLLKYGWNKFRDLLDGLAASGNRAEAARFISTMTADQLITDMGNAADDLAEFARQQAALRAKIGELLADLGKIGAKILLSLL